MRARVLGLLGLMAVAGCGPDLGLEDNIELSEAEAMRPTALVAAVHGRAAPEPGLIVDGRLWLPSGVPVAVSESDLRSVGSAAGQTVFARSWDGAPYDELFARRSPAPETATGGVDRREWHSYLPVLGGGAPTSEPGDAMPSDEGAEAH